MRSETALHRRPNRRRGPRAALLVGAAVLALVAVGCGDGDDDAAPVQKTSDERPESTDTTTGDDEGAGIASGILSDAEATGGLGSGVDADEEECLGASLIDSLGEEAATELADSGFAGASPTELEAVRTAFNDCVGGDAMAEEVVTSFYEGAGAGIEPSGSVIDCVAGEIDGKVGDLVVEGIDASSGATPEVTLDAMDACLSETDLAEFMSATFAQQGMSADIADCLGRELAPRLTVTDLYELGASGVPSSETEAALTEAGATCGAQIPGG